MTEEQNNEHWRVEVSTWGEPVLALESNGMQAGRELSEEDCEMIRTCAYHLLSFVGESQ
jgi:hypothetical protein